MRTTDQMRLFVAVELDEGVREALAALEDELRGRGLTALRWVQPEGIHLTLKFLGETPARDLENIERALGRATLGIGEHILTLRHLGTFGGRQSPRVLWVGLQGELSELQRLQRAVEKELTPLSFPTEDRAFSPHLTLARIRPENARDAAQALSHALPVVPVPPAEIRVAELSLMRSTLGPGGAVYTRQWSAPLGR